MGSGVNEWFDRIKNEFSYLSFYGTTAVNGKPMAIGETVMK